MTYTDPADPVLTGLERGRTDAQRYCGAHYQMLLEPYTRMLACIVTQHGGAISYPLAACLVCQSAPGSWVVQMLAFAAALELMELRAGLQAQAAVSQARRGAPPALPSPIPPHLTHHQGDHAHVDTLDHAPAPGLPAAADRFDPAVDTDRGRRGADAARDAPPPRGRPAAPAAPAPGLGGAVVPAAALHSHGVVVPVDRPGAAGLVARAGLVLRTAAAAGLTLLTTRRPS